MILLAGMLAGIVMGIEQDFALAPAYAHLDLVGGVLLFLFGLYYRLVPAAGTNSLAKIQGWLHIIGAIVFPVGVAVVILKGEALVAIPIAGSLIEIGRGKLEPEALQRSLEPAFEPARWTAPAKGLTLVEVTYGDEG